MDLKNLRREYSLGKLSEEEVDKDPVKQFANWFMAAKDSEMQDPNAFCLSTADLQGQPSLRTVLLKYFDEEGFVFFTNLGSRKANEIKNNPQTAMLFPWLILQRQVIIMGKAKKISVLEATKYFASRPRGSQIGAWVSDQSKVVNNRQILQNKFKQLAQKFTGKDIPMPKMWGGFRIVPHRFEFWQGGENRIHDRIEYLYNEEKNWVINRLMP